MAGKAHGSFKSTLIALGIVMTFLFGATQAWGSGGSGAAYVSDELLFQVKAGVSQKEAAEIVQGIGADAVSEISQIRVKRIKVPEQALERVKEALSHNPKINFVENNFLAEAVGTPNDRYYSSQWHLPKISAPLGWDISTGSSNIAIAIIDSGADPTHPDLSSKLIPGYNFVNDNADTHDAQGHGTAVAGSAAAIGNNYTGVSGVAWTNLIMPLVVVNSSYWASYYDISQAITYAADHGAKVMNISIAGSSSSSTLQNAVDYAWRKGAVIFASAGNYSTSSPYYPAACDKVVAVSATTSSDTLSGFSNYGNWVALSAPGESILTTDNGGGYGYHSGTSFSSPIAAGLGALIMSANPSLTNAQVVEIMRQNGDDLGAPGFDPYFGYGRINVYKSLLAATTDVPQSDTTSPSVSIASPANGSTVSGGVTVDVSATDNVGVSKVDLFINGILYASDSTGPYSFYWETSKNANGVYVLEALAYDSADNVGQSNTVQVYVNNPVDTVPPVVAITFSGGNYSSGGNYYVGKKLTIKATAADNVAVAKIELYVDNVRKTSSSGNTLTYMWNTVKVSQGAHVISVKAYDAAGNVGTSSGTVYK